MIALLADGTEVTIKPGDPVTTFVFQTVTLDESDIRAIRADYRTLQYWFLGSVCSRFQGADDHPPGV